MKKFSVMGLIILILLCFTGCGGSDPTLESYVDDAQYIKHHAGTWVVGEDINPGHYEITSTGPSFSLTVASNQSDASHTQLIGHNETVQSYTTWLQEGETVIIEDLEDLEDSYLIFNPNQLQANANLGAGCYIVGTDLDPGDYTLQVADAESLGHIYHFDRDGKDLSYDEGFETITAGHDVDLTLSEGDKIYVHNVNQVVLKRNMTAFTA